LGSSGVKFRPSNLPFSHASLHHDLVAGSANSAHHFSNFSVSMHDNYHRAKGASTKTNQMAENKYT
jgi:hypothetical protein